MMRGRSRNLLCFEGKRRGLSQFSLPFMALILLLSGCAVGPEYVKPPVPEQQEWIEKEDPKVRSEEADFSRWWTVFDDSVLNALVESAYAQNLPLRIAGIRILEGRAQLGIAVGEQYPQFQLGRGGYNYSSLSDNQANTTTFSDNSYSDIDVGFDAAWELDFWGKFRRAVQSEMASLEASIADYDDVLVFLTSEVARTYVFLRTSEERLSIARDNVKIQERSLQIAEARFKGGAVTELDVQQAKSLLRDTQAKIPRLESDIRQAKNALATLVGRLPGEIDEMLGGAKSIPVAPAEVAVGIPADLLRRRPDIQRAERQLAAQSPRIGIAKADLYPHFELLGSIGLRSSNSDVTRAGGSSLGDLFETDSIEFFFRGPSFRWDILNYGRLKNRVRVQDARFQQLVVNYEDTVLRAAQEVENALVAFLRSQEEVQFLSDSVTASKRSVDLSMIQYREGLTTYQRVIDTQRFLTQEQDFLAATTGSVATNLISVYKALGGGWQIRVGKDFVPVETIEEMSKRTDWGKLLSPEKLEVPSTEEDRNKWQWPDW
jgi:NodT family efflux transporter outer membrane factor (OMF) lipoprotein